MCESACTSRLTHTLSLIYRPGRHINTYRVFQPDQPYRQIYMCMLQYVTYTHIQAYLCVCMLHTVTVWCEHEGVE